MSKELFRYRFAAHVSEEDVSSTMLLAMWGTESLHGEIQARRDVGHFYDPGRRCCIIDASTPAGKDFHRLFAGFLRREFTAGDFHVERVQEDDLAVNQVFVSR